MSSRERPELFVSAIECRHGDHAATDRCRYQVAWSINPHMRVGAVEHERAVWQHASFCRMLENLGATVSRLPFVCGAFDSVFAKDNAIIVGERALLARPRFGERSVEQGPRARALEEQGLRVHPAPASPLEGGDIVMLPHGAGALMGHGFRSELASARPLERFLDAPVTPIELVDERLYHLDMAVAVLGDGTALVCKEALTPASYETLRQHCARVVPVPVNEALAFGANVVEVGSHLVLGGRAPKTAAALERLGWTTHRPTLDQFHLAGGSAACLVSRRHRADEIAPASTAA